MQNSAAKRAGLQRNCKSPVICVWLGSKIDVVHITPKKDFYFNRFTNMLSKVLD